LDVDGKKIIIDPFMGSGIIVIEAVLDVLNFPVRYYDKEKLFFTKLDFFKKQRKKFFEDQDKKKLDKKTNIYGYDAQLRYLKATLKNSKLAGINIKMNLSKISVEWLDTKFEKNSVDVIVTDPPRYGLNRNISKLKKTYNELFYQAEYILKKSGLIVIITRNFKLLEESAKNHKFKITEKYTLSQGKDTFNIIIFKR
jgi:23S rRNA G2445 N2-methylase RlmL